jgi:4-amino-4-deoxy-L-arabinose transferase-like glycosyltransferase
LAAGLVLTSPGIVALAATSMLELPAALALGCTMLVYCRLNRTPETRPVKHALLGVWIVLTYLVKTNYGVLLAICVVLTKLLEARFQLRPLLTRRNLYAALPVAVFCAIWFAWPPKIASTWDALVNHPYGGEQARGLAGLLFFPRSIVELGGPASALLCAGIVLSWKHRRESGIGFLLVLALTHFVIVEFHQTKLERHIVPMFPPMFVLTGVAAARLWEWLRAHGGAHRNLAGAFLAGLAVLQVASMGLRDRTPVVQALSPALVRDGSEVLDYVSAQADVQTPALVLHASRAWPYPSVLDWHLVSEGLLPVTAAGGAMDPSQDHRLAARIERKLIPEGLRASSRRVLRRFDEPSKTRSIHSTEWLLEDPRDYAAFVDTMIGADPPNAIIALVGRSDSTNLTVDLVERGIVENGYRRVSVREFRGIEGAVSRVYVYRRP